LGVAALGIGAAAWLLWVSGENGVAHTPSASSGSSAALTLDPLAPLNLGSVQGVAHIVFQNVVRDDHYAETSLVPVDSPAIMRVNTGLTCERVHFAGGRGICLSADHSGESRYLASVFGPDFEPGRPIVLEGAPVYARVSPDGRLAAASFQTSPPTAQQPFAPTQTWLIDALSGELVADLADFVLLRDGAELAEDVVDYWGVSFKSDGDGFFATVRFGGNIYLAEGAVTAAQLTVMSPAVSAPSLSPDESRIAYARLVSNLGPTWRFHVFNRDTGQDIELAETKSIDDQMEWLNSDRLIYGLATDIWAVPADGSGQAQPFLFGGLSPAVVGPAPEWR
jgi:hypothetical protein